MKLCYSNICAGDISVTENKLKSKVYWVLDKTTIGYHNKKCLGKFCVGPIFAHGLSRLPVFLFSVGLANPPSPSPAPHTTHLSSLIRISAWGVSQLQHLSPSVALPTHRATLTHYTQRVWGNCRGLHLAVKTGAMYTWFKAPERRSWSW